MTTDNDVNEIAPATAPNKSSWGSKLFFTTLVALLVFFWWILIYSGGVTGGHG